MSHRQVATTEIKDTNILARACNKLSIDFTIEEQKRSHQLFDGEVNDVVAVVNLKGWNYPVLVQEDGKIVYDNYNGVWGSQAELDRLLECYGEENAIYQLVELKGGVLVERTLHEDGWLELDIDVR